MFTWKLTGKAWYALTRSGHGVLIWSERGLSGFRMAGTNTIDVTKDDTVTEWELVRQTTS